jgi:cytochrome c553
MRLRRPDFLRRHPHVETLVAVAAVAGLAAAATVGFGLYNVSAKAPHLPPVHWALHTTYEQAVRLRAPPASAVPGDLGDPARVRLGAQHFDAACRQCHGAPGGIRQATVRQMRPQPPHVTEAVEGWAPRHLHWIVSEGVKMSGMPAWPAPRPDEPWSTVALLEAVRDMDGPTWDALVARPDVVGGDHAETFAFCAACHGTDGVGELAPFVPRLDILGTDYIARSLESYRAGARSSGYMQQAASARSPEALAAMAERFGALPLGPSGPARDPALVAEGEQLAKAGGLDDPACAACHGPPAPARAAFPNLSGQHEGYLATQLRLWREGDRGGELSGLMHAAAVELSDAEITALAAYYASLPPSRPGTDTAAR